MKHLWILALLFVGCASKHEDKIAEYQSTWHRPLTSAGGSFATLPPGVQNTVRAEAGSAEISQIVEEKIGGREVYTVLFMPNLALPPLHMARDGSIINPNLTYAVGGPAESGGVLSGHGTSELKLTDLPGPAMRALQEGAAGSTVSAIEKQTWGDRVVYVVTIKKEDKTTKTYITADGVVLKEPQK
jgi:hypothetical protein